MDDNDTYGSRNQIMNSAVVCPKCQVGQGEVCLTEDGGPRKLMHDPRVKMWQSSPWSVKYPRSVTSEEINRMLRAVGDDDS